MHKKYTMEQEALDRFLVWKGTKIDNLINAGYGSLFSNVTLMSLLLASLTKNSRPYPRTSKTFKDSYDYIIVGGGSAGSVMANRLSQHPCVSVLLLEAGGKAPWLTDVPAMANLFYGTKIDWNYMTEPQKYGSFAQKDNRVVWNSGRVLGGGSTLNAMMYVRGNKKNYDQWEAEGATGWSYKDVFPYFLKLEDNRNIDELDPGYHRTGGPLTAEKINYAAEIKYPILRATDDLGFEVRDINGARQTGIYDIQATVRNQQRCSTAKAYLVPAEDRPNLDILEFAFVRKIIIEGKRAVGVEFDYKRRRRTVRAKREVIVSNGSVRTPQLLMLSGIGPKEELRKFNISVVADLPVGKNLMDHSGAPVVYQVNDLVRPLFSKITPENLLDYLLNRKGFLCAPQQLTVMAFLDGLNTTSYSRDFPMQQLQFAEYSTLMALIGYNLKDEIIIEGKRAVGVEFDYKRRRRTVRAKREVIVSNGSVRTPQLLMLSGIGPKEELRKFNISVVADLPVGKNLMDHSGAPVVYQVNDLVRPLFSKITPENLLDYLLNRKGFLCAPQQLTVMAFLDGLNTTSYSRDFPMQQLQFAEYSTLMALIGYNLKDEIYREVFAPYDSKPLYICIAHLLQPKSRGTVTLRSTNPYDYPKIDPNYYQHPRDLRNVVEAMKICEAVAAHPSMQKFEARILDTMYPACHRFRGDETKFLTCVALQVTVTIWHPTGTARMGQSDDPRSVVDPQLRVIGVDGLRVVNAAVMPIIPSGNTNVPTIMIAEKAYDMMKGDIQCWGDKEGRHRKAG